MGQTNRNIETEQWLGLKPVKIGRNQLCPCGSGKKYKKCCRDSLASKSTTFDAAPDNELWSTLQRNRDLLAAEMKSATISVANDGYDAQDFSNKIRDSERVQKFISISIDYADRLISEIEGSRTRIFALVRRLAPIIVQVVQFEWLNSEESAGYRSYLQSYSFATRICFISSSLICSASSLAKAEIYNTEAYDSAIQQFASFPTVLKIARVIAVAAWLDYLDSRFLYANKNFRLFDDQGRPIEDALKDKTAIQSYEGRRKKFERISGSSGVWFDPEKTHAIRPGWCHWVGACCNLRSDNSAPPIYMGGHEFMPTYLVQPLLDHPALGGELRGADGLVLPEYRASQIQQKILPYDRLIVDRAAWYGAALPGIDAHALCTFLYTINMFLDDELGLRELDRSDRRRVRLQSHLPREIQKHIAMRWLEVGTFGFIRLTERGWVDALVNVSRGIALADSTVRSLEAEEASRLLKIFTFTAESTRELMPKLFVKLSRESIALDMLLAGDFIRHLLFLPSEAYQHIPAAKTLGDPAGSRFEVEAEMFILRQLGLNSEHVITNQEVAGKREIDLAFILNRTLFVIDYKAQAKNWEYVAGLHRKLRNRQAQFLEELQKKLPERILLISNGMTSLDPLGYDRSYGLVCTTSVEYLPEESSYWSCGYPLVGPPEELCHTIKNLSMRGGGQIFESDARSSMRR
jgi:hypothetical protein